MKAIVVYDSVFGNTEQIARAIAGALGAPEDVGVFRVGDVKREQLAGTPLLIVGSPTRSFRPTPAIAEFLKAIPAGRLTGVRAVAFDTRLASANIGSPVLRAIVNLGGYAAKHIAASLKKAGAEVTAQPEGFLVSGEQGPLKEGELERAANWARQYARI